MRLIFKVVVCFVVVALMMLAVLMYLEQKDGLDTSPTAVWNDIKAATKSAGEWMGGWFNGEKIRESAAGVLEDGAALIKGETHAPEETPEPE